MGLKGCQKKEFNKEKYINILVNILMQNNKYINAKIKIYKSVMHTEFKY